MELVVLESNPFGAMARKVIWVEDAIQDSENKMLDIIECFHLEWNLNLFRDREDDF